MTAWHSVGAAATAASVAFASVGLSAQVPIGTPLAPPMSIRGWVEADVRTFPQEGLRELQGHVYPSLAAEARASGAVATAHAWNLTLFGRYAADDARRNHLEVREATWTWRPATWSVRAGVLQERWGVVESDRLVDIINQRDQREAPDLDAKLGQPGIGWSGFVLDGNLEMLALAMHRPLTFADGSGRFQAPTGFRQAPSYARGAGGSRVDLAARWSRRTDAAEIAFSHFHGTAREPQFRTTAGIHAHYPLIDQTGVEAQTQVGGLLLKAEFMHRSGGLQRVGALTTGVEHTFTAFRGGPGDVTVFGEVTWDSRTHRVSTGMDRELFAAARWEGNDVDGSEAFLAFVVDLATGSNLLRLEAGRRVGDSWRVTLGAHIIGRQRLGDAAHPIRRDSFTRVGIARHF